MQRMLDAKDLQELFGIALSNVYKLMRRPDFPAIKVSARRYVVPEDAFSKWLDDQIINRLKELTDNGTDK